MIGLAFAPVTTAVRKSQTGPQLNARIMGLVENVTYGPTAQIGQLLSGYVSDLQAGDSVVHRWRISDSILPGANSADFMPNLLHDGEAVRYAPIVNGIDVESAPFHVRYAPPVAGIITPVHQDVGTGAPLIDVSNGFSGDGLTFAVDVPWATLAGPVLTIEDAVRSASATITAENSGGTASVQINVTILGTSELALSSDGQGELLVTGTSGAVTLTVSSPPERAGVYVFNTGDLATGPVNVIPPKLLGEDIRADDTLKIETGLWVYDEAIGIPSISYTSSGSGTINGLDYVADASDAGGTVSVTETLTQGALSRSTATQAVTVNAPPQVDPINHLGFVHFPNPEWQPLTNLDVTNFAAGDTVLVFNGSARTPYAFNVNGSPVGFLDQYDGGNERRLSVGTYTLEQSDIDAGSVSVQFVQSVSSRGHIIDAYVLRDVSVATVATSTGFSIGPIMPTAAENYIIHFVRGTGLRGNLAYTDGVTNPLYTTPTFTTENQQHGFGSGGILQNGSTTGETLTFTVDGSGSFGSFVLVVE